MQKIHKTTKVNLSTKGLSNFMYALLVCEAELTSSLSFGLREYSRKQMSRGQSTIMIAIREDRVAEFQEIAGVKLSVPVVANEFNNNRTK